MRFQSLTVVHVASQVTTFTFDKQKSCRDKSKSKPVCRIKPLEIKASASLIVTIITITKREREKKKRFEGSNVYIALQGRSLCNSKVFI